MTDLKDVLDTFLVEKLPVQRLAIGLSSESGKDLSVTDVLALAGIVVLVLPDLAYHSWSKYHGDVVMLLLSQYHDPQPTMHPQQRQSPFLHVERIPVHSAR